MNVTRHLLCIIALAGLFGCRAAKEPEAPEVSAEVSSAPVEMREIRGTVSGIGTVEFTPARTEALIVQVESQVVAVFVAAGAAVHRGDGLVRLRPSAATQLEVDRAVREAEVAEAERSRQARLRAEGLATDAELAAATSAAGTAKQLRDSLIERTGGGHEYIVKAPRDGIVDTLGAQPGDLVAAGATVARFGDSGALQAHIGLEPGDVAGVKAGAPATVAVLGSSGAVLDGKVTAVERRVDKDSSLAAALVSLPASDALMAGMPVNARIVVSTRPSALVVPREAILYEGDETSVFVVEAEHARRRAVHTGVSDDVGVEVLDGVKRGEKVVTTGNHELEDGMAVRAASVPAATAEKGKSDAASAAKKGEP